MQMTSDLSSAQRERLFEFGRPIVRSRPGEGGALPKNVFWQSFGQVMIGTTAHFEGIVLCQAAIVVSTGASVNGRLLAQTAVTLDQNAVTQPAL